MSAKRETDLDVVRGIAILLAMGWHFNAHETGVAPLDWLLWPGRAFGWAGVDLFFVLSGFLVGRLVMQERQRTGQFDARRFLVRRAFKLWPILYIFLALMALAVPWETFAWQIGTHLQNYIRTPVATHLWSLAVEEHFYLAFAVLFPIWARRCGPGGKPVLLGTLLMLILAAPVLRFIAVQFEVEPVAVQMQTQYRMDALSFGVMLSVLCVHYPALFERLVQMKWLWAPLALGLYAVLAVTSKVSPVGMVAGFSVSYLAGAALMLAIYRSGVEKWAPRASAAVAFMGLYSYAMYIWHVPAARAVEAAARRVPLHPALELAATYGAAIVVAWAVTRAIERPFLKLRDKLFPAFGSRQGAVATELVVPGSLRS